MSRMNTPSNIDSDSIYIKVEDELVTRKHAREQPIKVEILTENINIFLSQMESILEKTPENVAGKFKLTEITVSAEVSAKGSLVLLGTGLETTGTGGITFKFERK